MSKLRVWLKDGRNVDYSGMHRAIDTAAGALEIWLTDVPPAPSFPWLLFTVPSAPTRTKVAMYAPGEWTDVHVVGDDE